MWFLLFLLNLVISISTNCENIITNDVKQFYYDNGYVLIKDFLNKNILNGLSNAFDIMFDKHINDKSIEGKWKVDPLNNELDTSLLSIHDVEYHDSRFLQLLFNDILLCYYELGTNSSNVLLHHTKAHKKPAGIGSSFPPHQDYHYFPYKYDTMCAIFIMLDDCDPKNGCLILWPKSHKIGVLDDLGIGGYHFVGMNNSELESIDLIGKKGDAVMFHYKTVHASYKNIDKKRDRRMVLIQVVDANDEPLKNIHRYNKGQGLVLKGFNVNKKQESHYGRKKKEQNNDIKVEI